MYIWGMDNDPLKFFCGFHALNMEFVLSNLDHDHNPSLNKNYDLYPNMYNDELHLHYVLLVGSVPPKFVSTKD